MTTTADFKPTYPHVVMCEGEADELFFRKLADANGMNALQFMNAQSASKFGEALRALRVFWAMPGGNPKAILVVSDNDDNPSQSFRNVCRQLKATGYPIPNAPELVATSPGCPQVMVFMVPGPHEPGCLETLCLRCLYERGEAAERQCVDEFVRCAGIDRWPTSKSDEAKLETLLPLWNPRQPNRSFRFTIMEPKGPRGFPFDCNCYDHAVHVLRTFAAVVV